MSNVVSITEGLPPQHLVVAALEDVIARMESTLRTLRAQPAQGEPDVKSEISFFKRQLNAYNRALHYWLTGVRPCYVSRDTWLIPSGSRPGAVVHRITREGGLWLCGETCEAAAKGIVHWHNALLSAIEAAWELADADDDAAAPDPDEGNAALAALAAEREYEYDLAA